MLTKQTISERSIGVRRGTKQAAFSPNTQQQQQGGNIALSPLWHKRWSKTNAKKIEVQNKEMLMVLQSAAWPWEWWRLKLAYEPCRGLA